MLQTYVSPATFSHILDMEYACISLPADSAISKGESIKIYAKPLSSLDNVIYSIERIIVDFDFKTALYQDDTELSVIVKNPLFHLDQLGLSRVQK